MSALLFLGSASRNIICSNATAYCFKVADFQGHTSWNLAIRLNISQGLFSLIPFFSSKISLQILYSIQSSCLLWLLWSGAVSQTFFVEECQSSISQDVMEASKNTMPKVHPQIFSKQFEVGLRNQYFLSFPGHLNWKLGLNNHCVKFKMALYILKVLPTSWREIDFCKWDT